MLALQQLKQRQTNTQTHKWKQTRRQMREGRVTARPRAQNNSAPPLLCFGVLPLPRAALSHFLSLGLYATLCALSVSASVVCEFLQRKAQQRSTQAAHTHCSPIAIHNKTELKLALFVIIISPRLQLSFYQFSLNSASSSIFMNTFFALFSFYCSAPTGSCWPPSLNARS